MRAFSTLHVLAGLDDHFWREPSGNDPVHSQAATLSGATIAIALACAPWARRLLGERELEILRRL